MRDEPNQPACQSPVSPAVARQRKPSSGIGGFLRSFAAVALGDVGGQAAMALCAPVLSRLYRPEDYGVSGVVIALVTISAQIASLRYDTVVLTARSPVVRANAIALAIVLVTGYSVVLTAGLAAGIGWGRMTGSELIFLAPIMLLAPVLTLATSANTVIAHHLLLVSGDIRRLALVNFSRGTAIGGGQIGLGLLGFGPYGLVLGRLCGLVVAFVLSMTRVIPQLRAALPLMRRDRIRRVARANYRQALYQSPANMLNVVAGQTPIFLLAPLFGASIAGSYYFINALVMMGLMFFTSNASNMILRESARRQRNGEAVLPFILRLTLLVGVPAFTTAIALHFYAVPIITTIFGDPWELAGEVFTYTAFFYASLTVFIPISATAQLFRSQHLNMTTQMLRVIGAVSAIFYGAAHEDYMLAIRLLVISNVAIYMAAMVLMMINVRVRERR